MGRYAVGILGDYPDQDYRERTPQQRYWHPTLAEAHYPPYGATRGRRDWNPSYTLPRTHRSTRGGRPISVPPTMYGSPLLAPTQQEHHWPMGGGWGGQTQGPLLPRGPQLPQGPNQQTPQPPQSYGRGGYGRGYGRGE